MSQGESIIRPSRFERREKRIVACRWRQSREGQRLTIVWLSSEAGALGIKRSRAVAFRVARQTTCITHDPKIRPYFLAWLPLRRCLCARPCHCGSGSRCFRLCNQRGPARWIVAGPIVQAPLRAPASAWRVIRLPFRWRGVPGFALGFTRESMMASFMRMALRWRKPMVGYRSKSIVSLVKQQTHCFAN